MNDSLHLVTLALYSEQRRQPIVVGFRCSTEGISACYRLCGKIPLLFLGSSRFADPNLEGLRGFQSHGASSPVA